MWVWKECRSFNWATDPVTSYEELSAAIYAVNRWLVPYEDPPLALMYRGQDTEAPLLSRPLEGLGRDVVKVALEEMLAICRKHLDGQLTDKYVYFLMRHAGLPSMMVDWSNSWRVALWFAIHTQERSVKDGGASLWTIRTMVGTVMGLPTLYHADSFACERSRRQDGFAYCLHFEVNKQGESRIIRMNRDPIYGKRLVRIPIAGNYAQIEAELLACDPSLKEITEAESPIPEDVVSACKETFSDITGRTLQ